MKYIYNSIIIIALLSNMTSPAQSNNLDFTLESDSVDIAGQQMPLTSTIAKANNNIVWTQIVNGNTNVTSFNISGTTGDWDAQTSLGNIIYKIDTDGQQIELQILGLQTSISATLSVKKHDNSNETYVFNVNSMSY